MKCLRVRRRIDWQSLIRCSCSMYMTFGYRSKVKYPARSLLTESPFWYLQDWASIKVRNFSSTTDRAVGSENLMGSAWFVLLCPGINSILSCTDSRHWDIPMDNQRSQTKRIHTQAYRCVKGWKTTIGILFIVLGRALQKAVEIFLSNFQIWPRRGTKELLIYFSQINPHFLRVHAWSNCRS